jgi:isopenicillin N synthase-like dioxygenase
MNLHNSENPMNPNDVIFPLYLALAGNTSRKRVVDGIRNSILHTGFFGVQGLRYLTPDLVQNARDLSDKVFNLPDEVSAKYEDRAAGGQRGLNKNFGVRNGAKYRDLKIYWHQGIALSQSDPMYRDIGKNKDVSEVPKFGAAMKQLHTAFGAEMQLPLELLAESVGYPTKFFTKMTKGGDCLMRDIKYFPFSEDTPKGTMWAGIHTDSDFITGLLPGKLEGSEVDNSLEIQLLNDDWVRLAIPRDTIMINVKDFLSRMTCGRYRSTPHRVGPPEKNNISRRSTVFFVHPQREALLPNLVLNQKTFGPPKTPWEDVCAGYALFEVLIKNNAHRGPNPYTKTGRDPQVPPLFQH